MSTNSNSMSAAIVSVLTRIAAIAKQQDFCRKPRKSKLYAPHRFSGVTKQKRAAQKRHNRVRSKR